VVHNLAMKEEWPVDERDVGNRRWQAVGVQHRQWGRAAREKLASSTRHIRANGTASARERDREEGDERARQTRGREKKKKKEGRSKETQPTLASACAA